MRLFLRKYWPQVIITLVVALIAWLNYKPGTWLSGWDTLHPEFNFGLNFQRLLSVWHSEQGLGAIPGHSQIADLPRVFILWLLHFILPLNTLRYTYIFICLLLGPLGIYQLIKHLLGVKGRTTTLIAFLVSLFYLFNLSTLQQFFVPFEMFSTQYAFLPWIIYYSLKYLQTATRRNLLLFCFFTLLATPQAYAAHLWYAFFGIYTLFLILFIILNKKKSEDTNFLRLDRGAAERALSRSQKNVYRALILVALTLVINSFWLLPNIYYIFSSSNIPREAKQNRLYSQEYNLRNRENGYLKDVALVKGFYFNWTIYDFQKNRFEYLMNNWRQHLTNPFILAIGYLLFVGAILGIILSFLRKNRLFISFLSFFVIPFIFLMNHTFPFDRFFDFLLGFKLFDEALRFVFTKFSILLIFSYSIYLALFLAFIFEKITSQKLINCFVFIFCISLFAYSFPVFQGQLISDKLKIKIPSGYFQLWDFMERQQAGTVLSLPLYNFAGWNYYQWGYQGSGFIWFGLKQHLLDRDSDRWSSANEQAFREFHYAIYSRNQQDLENDLKKYNIQYILWDKNVITYSEKNRSQILYQREIQGLINNLLKQNKVSKIAQFGNVQIFKYEQAVSSWSQIIYPKYNLESYRWGFNDYGYTAYGDYVSGSKQNLGTAVYPYRSMLDVTDRVKKSAFDQFEQTGSSEGTLTLSAETLFSLTKNQSQLELTTDGKIKTIYLKTENFQKGLHLDLSALKHDKGYFLVFKSKNVAGMPLRFCLLNLYSNLCAASDELSENKNFAQDYFYIPPSENSLGYGLSVDNISYGDYDAINELVEIKIIALTTDLTALITAETPVLLPLQPYFVLRQSYHPGWRAYQDGKELKDHVLVNNWANGWRLEGKGKVDVVFWPQYLEYVGFGLLIISFLVIVLQRRKLL